ncbi:MAG: protease, partial [Bacteroidota bacterium]|nr:protease [Bacteroidota bacterium]
MKKLIYLPVTALIMIAASCSMHSTSVKAKPNEGTQTAAEKQLFATMQISDTVKAGDPVELNFTVYNRTDSVKKFLKWQTPFEPLMSKYLDIKNERG